MQLPEWATRPISRLEYLIAGVVLFAVKYPIDTMVAAQFDRDWGLPSYLSPRLGLFPNDPVMFELWTWLLVAALPFMIIGAILTARRLSDAGFNQAWALLFFAPLLNLPFLLLVLALPRRAPEDRRPPALRPTMLTKLIPERTGVAFIVSTLMSLGITMGCVLAAKIHDVYVVSLFTMVPVLNGALVGGAVNYGKSTSWIDTVIWALLSLGVWGSALLVTGMEGLGCFMMALPLLLPLTLIGAGLGRSLGSRTRTHVLTAIVLLSLTMPPLTAIAAGFRSPYEHYTETIVEIDAPPEKVWPHVVSFTPIKAEAEGLFFGLGYPVPMAAEITGTGVGATRRCIFDGGEFVEPITIWEESRHLAFDVESQPAAIPGWLEVTRGEFVLERLDDGRTRLIGRTYYRAGLTPVDYWVPWVDWGLRSIHERVLAHIGSLARPS